MSEECHLVEELRGDSQRDRLCLPNMFRSKKVKPLIRIQTGPTYQVYYTARELLLHMLDRAAVQELIRRAADVKTGANRPSYSQSKEHGADLSEGEYDEALTWISIVLQCGLTAGESNRFEPGWMAGFPQEEQLPVKPSVSGQAGGRRQAGSPFCFL